MTEGAPLRILVVEDEMMIAFFIEDCLLDLGHQVVGPAARVNTALSLIEAENLDCALLDVNVAGEDVYPAAVELKTRGVPFMFISGYGSRGLRQEWRNWPVLEKPFDARMLGTRIATLMQGA